MPPLQSFVGSFTPGAALLAYIAAIATLHYGKLWLEGRKLSQEDKQANREGFTKQVESLWAENRSLRQEYDVYRKQCEAETEQLRETVVDLEGRMSGLLRKMADVAIRAARGEIDQNLAEMILQLASEVGTKKGR